MRSKDHEKKQQTTSPIPVGLYTLAKNVFELSTSYKIGYGLGTFQTMLQ